ncbi:MAG: GNAT family N-acetyltransferase [bacterium]|nr:GNAT family N-acetyltransferase [bacterium]
MRVPILRGQRLTLEPLSPSHAAGNFELWSHPEVCAYSGECVDAEGKAISMPVTSLSESNRLLRFWIDRGKAGTGFRWAVLSHDRAEFLGAVGFNALGACAEYAYHFVPRHWGKGLAAEASHLALGWAETEGTRTVEAFILPENVRSVRLAEGLGFDQAGPGEDGTLRYLLTL